MEVAEGIQRLTRGVVNFYLLHEGGKLTVVDAGAPRDWSLLVRAVSGLGRRLDDIEVVLLTHAHSDHVGFAERARATTGATVWVHQADAARARGEKGPKRDGKATAYLLRPAFYRTVASLVLRGAGRIIPVEEVSGFGDGETLDVPGRPRAILAPGHTAGTCALLLEARRTLLTGDVIETWNPLTGRLGPQISPSGFNDDTQEALRSLDLVEGVQADLLLPGHGEPWRGSPAEAVRLARAAGPS